MLAFDSAAMASSAAVVTSTMVLSEVSAPMAGTHSRQLMILIHQAIADSGLALSDMDAIAVTNGPGSFTGLRIALSTAKGLSLSAGKPLVDIVTLDVLAHQAPESETWIVPIMDARKHEVYFSRFFRGEGNLYRERKDAVGSLETALEGIKEPCFFIGEGADRYHIEIRGILGDLARFPEKKDHLIKASIIGSLGIKALRAGRGADPTQVVPYYIRGADVRAASAGDVGINPLS